MSKVSKVKFIATFNPFLPNTEDRISKLIPYLHSDEVLKKLFPDIKFSVIYNPNKYLKEMVP